MGLAVSTENFHKISFTVQKILANYFRFVRFFIYRKFPGSSNNANFTIAVTKGLYQEKEGRDD